jgi:hypothetical protein
VLLPVAVLNVLVTATVVALWKANS